MTIFDGTKQDILDAVASGHVSEQDARDEFAVRHAEGQEGYEEYANPETDKTVYDELANTVNPLSGRPVEPTPEQLADQPDHDAPEVEYSGGDATPAVEEQGHDEPAS